jgi:SAM-dependent methyltransferase
VDFGLWTLDFGFQARRRALLLASLAAGMAGAIYYSAETAQPDGSALPRPWLNAPFVRTPDEIVDRMLALAAPREDEILYDLGCGDGLILVRAVEKYGCRAVGFDIDPQRVDEARVNAQRHGVGDRVTVLQRDIFTLNLAKADVVTLYLLPRLNERLIPQLKQLRAGARIVSHDFNLPGMVPDRAEAVTTSENQVEHVLYLWTTPLRAAEGT